MKTFVYVISGDHGRQKVGVTDNPPQRLRDLQTASPYQLRFEFVGESEDRAAGPIEVEAHFVLNTHKAPGGDEWFMVPPDVAITAVMASAHRLGYRLKPVDPDQIVRRAYEIGTPAWHHVMTAIAAVPAALAVGWLIYSFDTGHIGGLATILGALIVIGAMKLLRFSFIRIGNGLIQVDRAMHPD